MDVSKDHRYVASACMGPNSEVKIWDRQDYLCVFSWLTEYVSMVCVSFS
jgi:hypothetical protein